MANINLLRDLREDMLLLFELHNEHGKYSQMLLQHSDLNDKKNYDEKKCAAIRIKIEVIFGKIKFLKEKWF